MIHKAVIAAAGSLALAGSAYGGYAVIREQRANQEADRNRIAIQTGVREAVGKPADEEVRGNRPEGAGDGAPIGEPGARADVSGVVSAVGDGYADIATFTGLGAGSGSGQRAGGGRGSAETDVPMPETGETVRIILSESTEYLLSAGGPDAGQSDASFSDLGAGGIVSVWFAGDDDDIMKTAERIVIREEAVPVR